MVPLGGATACHVWFSCTVLRRVARAPPLSSKPLLAPHLEVLTLVDVLLLQDLVHALHAHAHICCLPCAGRFAGDSSLEFCILSAHSLQLRLQPTDLLHAVS